MGQLLPEDGMLGDDDLVTPISAADLEARELRQLQAALDTYADGGIGHLLAISPTTSSLAFNSYDIGSLVHHAFVEVRPVCVSMQL